MSDISCIYNTHCQKLDNNDKFFFDILKSDQVYLLEPRLLNRSQFQEVSLKNKESYKNIEQQQQNKQRKIKQIHRNTNNISTTFDAIKIDERLITRNYACKFSILFG